MPGYLVVLKTLPNCLVSRHSVLTNKCTVSSEFLNWTCVSKSLIKMYLVLHVSVVLLIMTVIITLSK